VSLRRQLPAYSPLPLDAVIAGLKATVFGARGARQRLTERLEDRFHPREVWLTDSGTSALTLALLAAARRRPGRPVALPGYGCYDLATAADGADVGVILYDLDPSTLGPDWDSFQDVLNQDPAALVIVHLYGIPVDLDTAVAKARAAGVLLVEDAAQAAGMTWKGTPAGAVGSFGVLSFGRGKGVTGGRGGALLVNDPEANCALGDLAGQIGPPRRGASELLPLVAQWMLARPEVYALPASLPFLGLGDTPYFPVRPRRQASDSSCAVLDRTWGYAGSEVETRQRNAARLLEAVRARKQFREVVGAKGGEASYLRLPLLAPPDVAAFAGRRTRALGVMPGYPTSLADLEGFARRLREPERLVPGARTLARQLGTLPTHSRLTETDLKALEWWLTRPH